MSRSRLIPGKTRTADFISEKLDPIILDYGIRQQLVGGSLERRFCLGLVRAGKFDVEHLTLTDTGDAIDAERFQRPFDGFALRIENPCLQSDGDACFHFPKILQLLTRTGPEPAGRSFSMRMPRRFATSVYASSKPPKSLRKRSLSSFSFDLISQSRQESGEISSATMIRIISFSNNRPHSILKSTRRMPIPRKSPVRKSLTRMASAIMSSISCGVAQPKAVMCSSDTMGSLSWSFL